MTRPFLLGCLSIVATACGQVRVATDVPASGVPGFDTSRYPGDDAMRAWRSPASPYRWVGFYLQSPCRRDTSWNGTRAMLEGMGWGIAILYVGQQAWEGSAAVQQDSAAVTPPACTRALLTESRGTADANDAIARAAAEGFAQGMTIFLDIERMSVVPDSMRNYYRAWVEQIWRDGRYRPGIYGHRLNADAINGDIESARAADPTRPAVRWWVTGGSDFTLARAPRDAGVAFASVWQGVHNARERWNDVTLDIDINVADRPSPSVP
jgi:hypothetical protein